MNGAYGRRRYGFSSTRPSVIWCASGSVRVTFRGPDAGGESPLAVPAVELGGGPPHPLGGRHRTRSPVDDDGDDRRRPDRGPHAGGDQDRPAAAADRVAGALAELHDLRLHGPARVGYLLLVVS